MKKVFQTDYIFLVVSLLIFVYILIRAIVLPAYHDEINSFFIFIQPGDFLPFSGLADQNNHVLNSFLSYLFFKVFGGQLIVLRLANVLSALVYLFYIWKIGKTFNSGKLAVAWLLTMTCSLYFISFFSLSRGYGLSMAFLVASIYHLIAYFKENKNKNFLIGLFTSILSVWAYLGVMVPVLITGSLFLMLAAYRFSVSKNLKSLKALIPGTVILYLIPIFYAVRYSFYLKTHSDLCGSDTGGFIQSVILNMVDEFSGQQVAVTGRIILVLILTILILASVLNFKRNGFNKPSTLAHLILWGTITGTIAMQVFIGVEYPKSRMAVYFFVLIMTALFHSVDESDNKISRYSAYLISSVFVLQFIFSFNFSYTPCWRYDTLPKSIYQKISADALKAGTLPTISTTEILGVEYAFQDFENNGKLNIAQYTDFPGYYADYIISNDPTIINTISDYDTVMVDSNTKVSLLKRREPVGWSELQKFNNSLIDSNNEFIPLIEKQDCAPYRDHPFSFEISFNAQSAKFPFRSVIVCDIWDINNKSLKSNIIKLQHIHSNVQNKVYFHRKVLFENIPAEANTMVFYCLNSDKTQVRLTDIEIKLLKGESY